MLFILLAINSNDINGYQKITSCGAYWHHKAAPESERKLATCLMWYVPSNTARDKHLIRSSRILKAYEIEYYLMGLESDVKRQLSLLLSNVNKHIVWQEVSCHDGELYHRW